MSRGGRNRSDRLAGIFDRSEISGLDARLTARLQRDRLRLNISELRLAELNPGFTFGPLLLRGHYEAAIDQPAKGRLTWQTAETRILGGRFWLPAGALDLAAPQQRLSARLEGVQLGDVLAAYPTEGLSGSGVIDGDTVVFVEVRYRRHAAWGGALESVDARKQQKLIKTAQLFL
ncbi:YdbH domain-containing protein, partial [Methylobacterium organophilum]|nr:YdbH domain-containing protein [Methylobacterium organophilum]